MDRRLFLQAAALAPFAARAAGRGAPASDAGSRPVWLVGDAAPPDPKMIASVLARVADTAGVNDTYLQGGAVQALEHAFAELLGKQDCAFFPTGTLANQVAIRVLAGENHHVLAQAESHLYRDESDTAERLAGLNLVPLAAGRATPSIAELSDLIDQAEKGPYPLKVGALSIESPVRRQHGEMVPAAAVQSIAGLARQHGIKLHLDGARLLLAPPSLDIPSYVAPFDTIYVSLYKYLGAPFGAVLAGDAATIERARDLRHVYGGLLYQGWLPAAVALDALRDFRPRISRAHEVGAQLVAALTAGGKIRRREMAQASNIYLLEMPEDIAKAATARGDAAGVHVAKWRDGVLPLYVNETILRRKPEDYAALFAV